jgi:hypothetical protein
VATNVQPSPKPECLGQQTAVDVGRSGDFAAVGSARLLCPRAAAVPDDRIGDEAMTASDRACSNREIGGAGYAIG